MTLPYCCVIAEFDGFTPEEHAEVCREPRPAPSLPAPETETGEPSR